jgi:exodeoxyribonuclease VII large subunit
MALQTSFENPVTVSALASMVGDWVERLGAIWVEGQITQISRRPGTSIVYLTLRDTSQDVSVELTCYRNVYDKVVPAPSEGARVVVWGKPGFYRPRGKFSLLVQELRPVGIGELLARLEELKRRLGAEGLFDPALKKRLPFLPARIGLICGRASAAERDVLENAQRRWPGVQFEVRETAVQGATAVPQIIAALAELDAHPVVDVIVIARGGGSVEDLLPFSDEQLIRAVAACATPVVSAIGHEPDSPLLDLVADLRASTPTDAAKRIVPDVREELERVKQARDRLWRAVTRLLDREDHALAGFRSRPALSAPYAMLDQRAGDVAALRDRAYRAVDHRVARDSEVLAQTLARVRALSPLATLERGYAVVQRADGAVVRKPEEVAPGDPLSLRLAGGVLPATVSEEPVRNEPASSNG